MRILVINVNTSPSMTENIGNAARRHASAGTQTLALQPYFGAEAVDCNMESYLSAVAVMDRVLAYDGPFDAVVLAGFGEHGRDGLQELIEQPVVEICAASAHVAMLIGRAYSVVTTLQRSVPAIEDRLRMAGLEEAITTELGVPVVDGVGAAVRLAEAVVGLGLRTSKISTYAPPDPKKIIGWPLSAALGLRGGPGAGRE